MATSAERMRALRERERRGLRRFTIGASRPTSMLELWRGGWRAVAGREPSGGSWDRGQRSATCSALRRGYGCGANDVSTTRR